MTRRRDAVRPTLPGPSPALLQALLDDLDAQGCPVPGAEEYSALLLEALTLDPPPKPQSLLELDGEGMQAHMRALAEHHVLAEVARNRFAPQVQQAVCVEMAGVVREHADALVTHLNTLFEPLFAQARDLRARGVRETHTAADVITMDEETIHQWNNFPETAAELDALAELRFDLTRVALVAPGTKRDQPAAESMWGVCLGNGALTYDQPGEGPVARWLRLAANPDVRLTGPSEIDALTQLTHDVPELNIGMLAATAAARHTEENDQ